MRNLQKHNKVTENASFLSSYIVLERDIAGSSKKIHVFLY